MAPIATYVFLDSETTGLPNQENNQTKITELSLVAVKRDHLLNCEPGNSPRVLNKWIQCFNPGRKIQEKASEITGLTNELLATESSFNLQVIQQINDFLNQLPKPVCLVAYNGMGFDYPIFRNHLVALNRSLPEDLLCTDCMHAFYDILEGITDARSLLERRFPWASFKQRPKTSYKLVDVYERVLGRASSVNQAHHADGHASSVNQAHHAEYDCVMQLEIAVSRAGAFVRWADEDKNCVPFSNITPMGAIG